MDKAVHVGDFCEIGGRLGTVEDIGLRSLKLRTLDQNLLVVPNGALAQMQFQDMNRQMLEQVETALGDLSDQAAVYAAATAGAAAPTQRLRDLLDRWNSAYVMTEQRVAHGSAAANTAAAASAADRAPDADGPKIELF